MKIRTRAAAMTIAAASVFGSVAVAAPAHAAGYGQQLNFCGVPVGEGVEYSGTNQNGVFSEGSTYLVPNVCDQSVPGWWWIGTVTIKWISPDGNYQATTYCQVPVSQSGSDWTDCYI